MSSLCDLFAHDVLLAEASGEEAKSPGIHEAAQTLAGVSLELESHTGGEHNSTEGTSGSNFSREWRNLVGISSGQVQQVLNLQSGVLLRLYLL